MYKSPKRSPKRSLKQKSPVRKGPSDHARNHRVGEKMMGLDGNMWKIKMINKKDGTKYKRWVKI